MVEKSTTETAATAMLTAFGAMAVMVGGIFFFVIINTFMGGLAGWVVGLVFGETILSILAQLGIHGVTMFQFGAFMGFVGGFLKTKVTHEKVDN